MSGMYDEPKVFEGNLEPYPHAERPEVRRRRSGADRTGSTGGRRRTARSSVIIHRSTGLLSTTARLTPTPSLHSPLLVLQRGRAADPVAYLQAVEQRARERQVAYETVKLLRQRVIQCYRREGVNHYENCRQEATDYYNVVTKKDLGQLQPEWSNPAMKDGW